MLRYDQGWRVASGDPTLVIVPGVARPMRMWSNERAVLACRSANTFGDVMEFLRKVRDEVGRTADPARLLELASMADQLHSECVRQARAVQPS